VPITNHGITIAYTLAIFERALEPFPSALETYRELTRAAMHSRRPGSTGTRRAAGRGRPALHFPCTPLDDKRGMSMHRPENTVGAAAM